MKTKRAKPRKMTASSRGKKEKAVKKPRKAAMPPRGKAKPIGSVTHFFGDIKVAIVKFKKPIKKGVKISFRGATTNFDQVIKSMQHDHKDLSVAPKGKEIGIKVSKKVREGDEVFES